MGMWFTTHRRHREARYLMLGDKSFNSVYILRDGLLIPLD